MKTTIIYLNTQRTKQLLVFAQKSRTFYLPSRFAAQPVGDEDLHKWLHQTRAGIPNPL